MRRMLEGALLTLALVAVGAALMAAGAARRLRESRLPGGLAYGLWGGAGLLAGALLWRAAFAEGV